MPIPKKGSRAIAVDSCNFRWRVRHRPTHLQGICCSNLILAVEAAESSGSNLIVELPQMHARNCLNHPTEPVLPSQVATYIRQAMNEGWLPNQKGKPFIIDAR